MVSVHSTQAFLGHALLVNMVQEVKGFQSFAKWLFLRLILDVLISCLYSPATVQALVMFVEMTPPSFTGLCSVVMWHQDIAEGAVAQWELCSSWPWPLMI